MRAVGAAFALWPMAGLTRGHLDDEIMLSLGRGMGEQLLTDVTVQRCPRVWYDAEDGKRT